ncbi:MAG: DNA repair ATPase [Acidobacteriota bacterium]
MADANRPNAVPSDATPSDADAPAAIDRGTFDLLRERLRSHAETLRERADALNQQRLDLFGGGELALAGSARIRTENNCVPRDIVAVDGHLLFGYNVVLGLKRQVHVGDVFSLHAFARPDDGDDEAGGEAYRFERVPAESPQNFLRDPGFVKDFEELYRYYKDARLLQLRNTDGRLLMIFQTGRALTDQRVFRWALAPDGGVSYLDNRGEREHVLPPSHDFDWVATGRDDYVLGRHPHVNILDEVFVETVGGDLTVKVEDNTEDGLGIYREDVDDANQALDDGEILYAKLGTLILLKIRPYREETWRYLVFNIRTRDVRRIDAIGRACVQLPEDHGILFPGGYYLQSGETKVFDGVDASDLAFKRTIRAPNGEDVLYLFRAPAAGRMLLLSYNLIRRSVQNPLRSSGYSLFDDGLMALFRADSAEPTRVHALQVWRTPYVSDEHAAAAPSTGSHLEVIGNAELVRGISDALSMAQAATGASADAGAGPFEDLIRNATRALDVYLWLDHDVVGDLQTPIRAVRDAAEEMVAAYERTAEVRRRAAAALREAEGTFGEIQRRLDPAGWTAVDDVVGALGRLRRHRGHVLGLKEMRFADAGRIEALAASVAEAEAGVTEHAASYLLGDDALAPYRARLAALDASIDGLTRTADAAPVGEALDDAAAGLELLTEVLDGLDVDDPTVRTRILETVAEVLSSVNRVRARFEAARRALAAQEGAAEFGAQYALLSQGVGAALAVADTPEGCDAQLAKLMLRLESLETRFADLDDDFADKLATKREDIYEAFSTKRQGLVDARQRKAARLASAADRVLEGIVRRGGQIDDGDALLAYFAADPMVTKLRDLAEELRTLGEAVQADELEGRLKTARDEAARGLRDRRDLFDDGDAESGPTLRLGRHRFSVNTRPVALTVVPQGDGDARTLVFQLTGTDYRAPVASSLADGDDFLDVARPVWDMVYPSENDAVYRAEFLAWQLFGAHRRQGGATTLERADIEELARRAASARYDEGYARGVHDHDAARILEALHGLATNAARLAQPAEARALGSLFWTFYPDHTARALWQRRARSLGRLAETFGAGAARIALRDELTTIMDRFARDAQLPLDDHAPLAAAWLVDELAHDPSHSTQGGRLTVGGEAAQLLDGLRAHLQQHTARGWLDLDDDLRALDDVLGARYALADAWIGAYLDASRPASDDGDADDEAEDPRAAARAEAVAQLLVHGRGAWETVSARVDARITGLLGQHARVRQGALSLRLDTFTARLDGFERRDVPAFRAFQRRRHDLLEAETARLRLGELEPKVMGAFVRNRLIDEVYLPLIGDNLAKQMGAVGADRRTDQMGLLLLISPPGYGKTTLMEYVAQRLGLVFVKVNGPALGHGVVSLDPAEAPNATARQEVEKIGLALEMGNNVLLYLDDIQHTHPELLQKFISLCDAQRRIEGVWRGRTRTYDLRGKRFAVCMAGNPYTEAGEAFQIPDMLANRADTYNLGDMLAGREHLFALSYVENSLTSNAVLAPLAARDPEDARLLIRRAAGEEVDVGPLAEALGGAAIDEMVAVLRHALACRTVLLQVNQTYIESAAQADAFRTEPRFQLQGSYRNMNKLVEKLVPAMNDAERAALLDDHYRGEAQTLTTGAEANLLKLAELRGTMTDAQAARWREIKRGFARVQAMGGDDDDPAARLIGQVGLLGDRLGQIGEAIETARQAQIASTDGDADADADAARAEALQASQAQNAAQLRMVVEALQASAAQRADAPAAVAAASFDADALAGALARGLGVSLRPVFDQLADIVARPPAVPDPPAPVPPAPAPASPVPPVPSAARADGDAPIAPYLDRLDATLGALAKAAQGPRVVQVLSPSVLQLLERLGRQVGDQMIELVRGIDRRLKTASVDDRGLRDQLDRALREIDQLSDLVEALRKIDTRSLGE